MQCIPQKKKGDFSMNAPAKGMLKVVSILLIIFGAIATIVSLIAVTAIGAITSMASSVGGDAAEVVAAAGGLALIALIIPVVDSILTLVFGIVGVGKKTADPSKGGFYVVAGIILCILALLSIILTMSAGTGGFPWTSLIGFVLPILYIVGGLQNKKAASAAPYQPPMQ